MGNFQNEFTFSFHSGITGNELVDQLAKSTVNDFKLPQTFLPITKSTLKSELKN